MTKKFDIDDLQQFVEDSILHHPDCAPVLRSILYRVRMLKAGN